MISYKDFTICYEFIYVAGLKDGLKRHLVDKTTQCNQIGV